MYTRREFVQMTKMWEEYRKNANKNIVDNMQCYINYVIKHVLNIQIDVKCRDRWNIHTHARIMFRIILRLNSTSGLSATWHQRIKYRFPAYMHYSNALSGYVSRCYEWCEEIAATPCRCNRNRPRHCIPRHASDARAQCTLLHFVESRSYLSRRESTRQISISLVSNRIK